MGFDELRTAVLDARLCTSCGVCELACPKEVIAFDGLEPVLTAAAGLSDEACGDCHDCLDACPGLDPRTPDAELRLFGRVRDADERWIGVYREVVGARARDGRLFEASASGGSITGLLQASIDCLGVDAVLTMGRAAGTAWRAAPSLSESAAELVETTQSTYQLAPYLGALRTVMRQRPESRVAMSGIACHVQGVRKLQTLDTEAGRWAREHVVFVVELACSSGTTPRGTEAMIEDLGGVAPDSVTRLRYREGEYPGNIRIWTDDGTRRDVQFWKAVRHFAGNKTHRCLSCGDWMSGLADVSVSDGDPNIFAASVTGTASVDGVAGKHGRVFVRTERGAEVLRHAVGSGVLETWPIDLVGMNLGLERKRNRRATYERSGQLIPAGPIPGFVEELEARPDEEFIAAPAPTLAAGASGRNGDGTNGDVGNSDRRNGNGRAGNGAAR